MPTLKQLYYLMMVACGITQVGCDKDASQVHAQLEQTLEQSGVLAPKAVAQTLESPTLPDDIINQTAQTLINKLDYQIIKGETYYFDKNGLPQPNPQKDGYYRKVVGKTFNGEWVVQDFYADTNLPQSNIFAIKADGNLENFDSLQNDSDTLSFDKAGNLVAYAPEPKQGKQSFFFIKDKKVFGQMMNDNELYFYYPNSQILMAHLTMKTTNSIDITLYHRTGFAMATFSQDNGTYKNLKTWDDKGKSTSSRQLLDHIDQEIMPTIKQYMSQISSS